MKKHLKLNAHHLALNKGMTLAELLVASILIGIVMIGTFSFSQAVKQIHQTTDRSTIPAARVAAAMARIQSDAVLMSGDGYWTGGDPNIGSGLFYYQDGNAYGLCFRHDTDDDPSVFTNDQWACYSHDGDRKVWRCTINERNIATFTGCPAGGLFARPVIHLASGSEAFYVIQAHPDPNEAGREVLDQMDIVLSTKIDPDDAGNDPMINPPFTLSSSINPWAQGR